MFSLLKELKDKDDAPSSHLEYLKEIEQWALTSSTSKIDSLTPAGKSFLEENIKSLSQTMVNASYYYMTEKRMFNDQILKELDQFLTPTQRFLNQKLFSINSQSEDIGVLMAKYDDLENEILIKSSEEELPTLMAALYTARYSTQYWYNNEVKWKNEFGSNYKNNSRTNCGSVSWGAVAGSDAATAVAVGSAASPLAVGAWIGWAAWGAITGTGTVVVSAFTGYLTYSSGCLGVINGQNVTASDLRPANYNSGNLLVRPSGTLTSIGYR